MLSANVNNVQRWSKFGVLCAWLQFLSMMAIAIDADSVSVISLNVVTVIMLTAYHYHHRHILKGHVSDSHKYFCIVHVIVATWLFFLSQLVLLLHARGIQVLAILFDDNLTNDLLPAARRAVAALFAIVVVSLVVDAYCIAFHTKRLQGTAGLTSFPRVGAGIQALVDLTLLAVSIFGLQFTGHLGFIAPLVVALLSLVAHVRHSNSLRSSLLHLDSAQFLADLHIYGQLLSLQHALLASVVFLANLGLLLIYSVGGTVGGFLSSLPPVSFATMALGVLAYAGLLVTTVILVGLVTQMTADQDGSLWASEALSFRAVESVADWSAMNVASSRSAVPVSLTPLGGQSPALPVSLGSLTSGHAPSQYGQSIGLGVPIPG